MSSMMVQTGRGEVCVSWHLLVKYGRLTAPNSQFWVFDASQPATLGEFERNILNKCWCNGRHQEIVVAVHAGERANCVVLEVNLEAFGDDSDREMVQASVAINRFMRTLAEDLAELVRWCNK